MKYLLKFLLPLLTLWQLSEGSSLDPPRDLSRDLLPREYTTLTAVTVRKVNVKREEKFIPRIECEHHYVDHSALLRGSSSRYATTSLTYKLPTLVLEDIEEDIIRIECSNSAIIIEFPDTDALVATKETWDRTGNFLAITSHPTCNEDGTRAVHMVSAVLYDFDLPMAVLSAKPVGWNDAYDSMTVRFGTSAGKFKPDALRFHDSLLKRQVASSATGSTASSTPTSESATPSATPTANSSVFDIGFLVPQDKQIFSLPPGNGSVRESLTVSCKTCSMSGTVEITEGEFTISNSTTAPSKALNFIKHGFFKAATSGLNAELELDTVLSLSSSQKFKIPLAQITVPGFSIPDIATIGPSFTPFLTGSIEIEGELGFTYGFSLTVPESSLTVNIANLTQSSSTGFSEANITAIPFAADSPEIDLTLKLGLRLELGLGVDILHKAGSIGADVFLDVPTLEVRVSQIAGANADCVPLNASSTLTGFLSHIFPDLTHITADVTVDTGLELSASLDVPDSGIHTSADYHTTLLGTNFPLPTTCLLWDGKNSAFASPTFDAVSTTASDAAKQTGEGSSDDKKPGNADKVSFGVKTHKIPTPGNNSLWYSVGMLLIVFLTALCL